MKKRKGPRLPDAVLVQILEKELAVVKERIRLGLSDDKPGESRLWGRPKMDRSAILLAELDDGLHGVDWQRRCYNQGVSKSSFWRAVEELKRDSRVDKTPNGKWVALRVLQS